MYQKIACSNIHLPSWKISVNMGNMVDTELMNEVDVAGTDV